MISSQQHYPREVTLVVERDDGSRAVYDLETEAGVFLGTSCLCGVQLEGSDFSSIHCRIGVEEGTFCVQDWGSTIGTFVNGQKVETQADLAIGHKLKIGDYHVSIVDHARRSSEATVESDDSSSGGPSDDVSSCEESSRELPSVEEDGAVSDVERELTAGDRSQHLVGESEYDAGPAELDSLSSSIFSQAGTDDTISIPERSIPERSNDLSGEATSDCSNAPPSFDTMEMSGDLYDSETYDRETVDLLRAEIDDLRAALARRDAQLEAAKTVDTDEDWIGAEDLLEADESTSLMSRMQELIDEADCADERMGVLQDLLHSSEVAMQAEQEERVQLEAWVRDIEQRIGQREDEHLAEIEGLRRRIEEATRERDLVQRQVNDAASSGGAPQLFEETLERLQQQNNELQEKYAEVAKENTALKSRLESIHSENDQALREERANLTQELAKASRMRFELTKKLAELDSVPVTQNHADLEAASRLKALRDHLRDIHEQEVKERSEATLTSRLSSMWKRLNQ